MKNTISKEDERRFIWKEYVKKNKDKYGLPCIKVAREIMKVLDKDPTPLHNGYYPDYYTSHGLMVTCGIKIGEHISGFQAQCVVEMIYKCHKRGKEFRNSYKNE